jgi:hypothetical protein
MRHDAGAIVPIAASLSRRPRTFLGSETAPDDTQIRRRLTEIRQTSQRRKSYATCAVAACTLLIVFLNPQSGPQADPEARAR